MVNVNYVIDWFVVCQFLVCLYVYFLQQLRVGDIEFIGVIDVFFLEEGNVYFQNFFMLWRLFDSFLDDVIVEEYCGFIFMYFEYVNVFYLFLFLDLIMYDLDLIVLLNFFFK